ncbi:MAG: hypothetical protein QM477_10795 [Planctomycetota bacterium]
MQIQSPAKLNWTLEILGRRADGLHELRSWFVAVGLFDTLQAQPCATASTLSIRGPMAQDIPTDGRNLVLQADALWRKAGGQAPFLAWELDKHIPSAGGLGGGSGNAAAALLLLQKISAQQPQQSLESLALELGSDVPFFLQAQSACLMGGQGEILLASATAPELYVVLAIPNIPVPTADVFRVLQAPDFDALAHENAPSALCFPREPGVNDLLSAARRTAPALAAFEAALCKVACFHLSGSGGTFFCTAEDSQSATEIAAKVHSLCQHVCVVPLLRGPAIAEI